MLVLFLLLLLLLLLGEQDGDCGVALGKVQGALPLVVCFPHVGPSSEEALYQRCVSAHTRVVQQRLSTSPCPCRQFPVHVHGC
jgi:hypothetical protein